MYCNSPGNVKDDVINNASGGRKNLASVSYVEGAGHLVGSIPFGNQCRTDIRFKLPQTHPKALASHLAKIMDRIPSRLYLEAKL